MGRWSQYDEDDYRLPDGMKRVGYDSDTQKYYYRDHDGALWEGAEGTEYGELTKVEDAPAIVAEAGNDDVEAGGSRADGYRPLATDVNQPPRHIATSAYRNLLPFFLLICVVLLLLLRVLRSGSAPPPVPPDASFCPGDSSPYRVKKGDTCWQICQTWGCNVEKLEQTNPRMRCDSLAVDEVVCLPSKEARRRLV
ncbi:hypothetical protein GLOTRDRAFT_112810 [Gloeophyllum trabeum ATCC 11539]|uniref:LysM domain-containing protein n=1 Tax=Gloeophyllum trabeum (strain ATCC 11539 / FP-39264 / Madison 617) TaxID=670483 RepID=S7QJX5_GLOTA|nr:uncharacterized protein GLOTRDRAFT_112810 [Gloeophyllum trabeum ATCC 11539]EPQ60011.1 hypothetical protein GLOTRDRAFT_112810 [Gloeophyllum trabeum ATCC 11539]